MSVVFTITDKIRFITSAFGSGKLASNSKNFDVWCPVCAPFDKSKKKLAIRLEDDANHCWSCGWRARNLAPLLKKYSSMELLADYSKRFMLDEANKRFKRYEEQNPQKPPLTLPKDFRLLAIPRQSDPDAKAALRYVYEERNLTLGDLWKFKIGLSDEPRWHRRVIVPSFDNDGNLNFFVARAIDSFKHPKYDNPDVDKRDVIFNEVNVDFSKQIVVCEGAFDLFNCGENAVALMGSDLNEQSMLFTTIITNSTPVALALDGDMWESKTLKIAKKLAEYNVDVSLVDTREFQDPGQATKEQFKKALENAILFDWRHEMSTRLNRASRVRLASRRFY